MRFGGNEDRARCFAKYPVEHLPQHHAPCPAQNLRAEAQENRLLLFGLHIEDHPWYFADERTHPRPLSHYLFDLVRAGRECPLHVAKPGLRCDRVGVTHHPD